MGKKHLKHPVDELHDLQHRTSAGIAGGILRLARAVASGKDGRAEAQALNEQILQAMHYADLLGRRRVLLEYDAAIGHRGDEPGKRSYLLAMRSDLAGQVRAALGAEGPPFLEMIRDLLAREPRLAATGDAVARIYQTQHAFAAAYSPTLQVTRRVQNAIADLQQQGVDTNRAINVLAEMADWSKGYAQTVFRTNVTTAYAAGRWQQVSDPVVREVVPAFRYTAIGDVDTRPNHAAADGLIAGLRDPIWERFTPPLGYQCRCSLEMVDRFELERMGLINPDGTVRRFTPAGFSGAHPDSDRFGNGRPDRQLYGF